MDNSGITYILVWCSGKHIFKNILWKTNSYFCFVLYMIHVSVCSLLMLSGNVLTGSERSKLQQLVNVKLFLLKLDLTAPVRTEVKLNILSTFPLLGC